MGLIRITYETITPESAEDGDIEDSGWKDEEGTEYTEEEVISLLRGCVPSSSFFYTGIWYTMYGDADFKSGECENVSYHLDVGTWTLEERRRIYTAITNKQAVL